MQCLTDGDRPHGVVRVVLQRDHRALAVAAVGGDHRRALGVLEAPGQGVGGEAAEHDAVRGADPRTGQHGDRQLGDHGHVDRDPVALADAQLAKGVRHLARLGQELGVGDRPLVARLALPVVGDLVSQPVGHVAVEAVDADVQLAADEPLGERRLPLERCCHGSIQSIAAPLLGPELLEALVAGRPLVDGRVVGNGRGRELRGGGKVRSSLRRFSMVASSGRASVVIGGRPFRRATGCRASTTGSRPDSSVGYPAAMVEGRRVPWPLGILWALPMTPVGLVILVAGLLTGGRRASRREPSRGSEVPSRRAVLARVLAGRGGAGAVDLGLTSCSGPPHASWRRAASTSGCT